MALRTTPSFLDRLPATPGPTGLVIGLSLTAGLLVATGSVDTALAGAVPLVVLGLVCAYAVDTALQWGRWLDDVTRDRPDTPVQRLRSGRGRRTPGARSDDRGDADSGADPVARARERYVSGELDEAAFERELEVALSGSVGDATSRARRAHEVDPDTAD